MKSLRTWPALLLLLVLAVSGCVSKNYQIHPGAVDEFDSRTYDVILSAQAGLDQAKVEYEEGNLPARALAIINRAGDAYNALVSAHSLYREWKLTGVRPADAEEASLEDVQAKVERLIRKVNRLVQDVLKLFQPEPASSFLAPGLQWRAA